MSPEGKVVLAKDGNNPGTYGYADYLFVLVPVFSDCGNSENFPPPPQNWTLFFPRNFTFACLFIHRVRFDLELYNVRYIQP